MHSTADQLPSLAQNNVHRQTQGHGDVGRILGDADAQPERDAAAPPGPMGNAAQQAADLLAFRSFYRFSVLKSLGDAVMTVAQRERGFLINSHAHAEADAERIARINGADGVVDPAFQVP